MRISFGWVGPQWYAQLITRTRQLASFIPEPGNRSSPLAIRRITARIPIPVAAIGIAGRVTALHTRWRGWRADWLWVALLE
jgi:hypothetical protein